MSDSQTREPPPLTDPLLQNFDDFVTASLATPGTSRHAEVAGIRLHYLEWSGPPGAPVLLLLHGYLAHAHWWDFVAPWLATQYRVIALDFGGMGDSQYRPEYRHEFFHAEINGLVEALGIAGCTAIAHSYGGRALLYACAARPGLVARAIAVDSRLGTADDPVGSFIEEWRPKKRYADQSTIQSRFMLRPEEPAPAAAMAHMARMSVREETGGWVWKFDENLTRLFHKQGAAPVDDTVALAGLPTPVDFVYGELSRVVTPARAAQLAGCVPQVRSVTGLPGSHHHLPLSQPVALVAALRILLQRKTS
jgi:pimeloyl-ACP methyl ester carboxylesterase